MTGRQLYDLYCDATKEYEYGTGPLISWPWLSWNTQRKWSAMATKLEKKKRVKR